MSEEIIEEIYAEEEDDLRAKGGSNFNVLLLPQFGFDFIISHGWLILGAILIVYYMWSRYRHILQTWSGHITEINAQDAESFLNHQRAMEVARQRMQDELNQSSILERERLKEKEELKRRQKIEEWEHLQKGRTSGRRLNDEEPSSSSNSSKLQKKDEKSLRDDYNPLMGSGNGTCFRPSRRGGGGGGG